MDPFVQFKNAQKHGWAHFAPLASHTVVAAARLVRHARIQPGQRVLDVACGTGVVAVTAARAGAVVTGLDLTPELLAHARENAKTAGVSVDWREGDAEELPFDNESFDVVVSQFGHIFAPRPDVVTAQMLRVLKPGGTLAFSTWPPELFVGRAFVLTSRYAPPPPPGVVPPVLWGDPAVVRARLGEAVADVAFDRDTMYSPALSPQHLRALTEQNAGPMRSVVETLHDVDPQRLAQFRAEYDALITEYLQDNTVRQGFLLTRARKR